MIIETKCRRLWEGRRHSKETVASWEGTGVISDDGHVGGGY